VAVKLTAAQARALGIADHPAGKARTTRKVAAGPYRTTCVMCRESFTTMAAEDRHLAATGHPRYALVLEVLP
jgi:hypothetical protein